MKPVHLLVLSLVAGMAILFLAGQTSDLSQPPPGGSATKCPACPTCKTCGVRGNQNDPPLAPSCPPAVMVGGAAVANPELVQAHSSLPNQAPAADDLPPVMKHSHYYKVHGLEPFERPQQQSWSLHTIPTDDWYGRAAQVAERCDHLGEDWPGEEDYSDDFTLVTVLLDLKRGEGQMGAFQRSMSEYYARFNRVIARGFKMVMFIPEDFIPHLNIDKSKHYVIPYTVDDLRHYFPYLERLTKVRTSELWQQQAKELVWLAESPQGRLEMYSPLVMSKINMLRDVSRINPFKTKNLMFLDAGHLCAGALDSSPGGMSMFERHFDKFFITHWPYGSTTEVHGLLDKAMHLYVGTEEDPLRIVRGGIFGGRRAHIECVARVYNIALHQTLEDGYMGTEENFWAIIFARFPELFHGFDNNSLGNHGDNCAAFVANQREQEKKKAGGVA